MTNFKVLAICGSLRKASTNHGLIRHAVSISEDLGVNIQVADLLQVPFFNQDFESTPSASVTKLVEQAKWADAVLFACPEYNYSLAPPLKNAIDWISRYEKNAALKTKVAGICGSGGGMGTSRAQYHLRQCLVFLEMMPVNRPEVFSNAYSAQYDSSTGDVMDAKVKGLMKDLLVNMKQLHTQLRK
jgi:chromate reductase